MNWTTLALADLKDSEHAAVIDAAEAMSTGSVNRIIASVISRVRGAIAPGNQLDVSPSKIPNSLKDLAERIAVRLLRQKLHYDLTQDERDQRKEDNAYLAQISTDKIRFETPDNPAASAEMQEAGVDLEQSTGGNLPSDPSDNPAQVFTRESMKGL